MILTITQGCRGGWPLFSLDRTEAQDQKWLTVGVSTLVPEISTKLLAHTTWSYFLAFVDEKSNMSLTRATWRAPVGLHSLLGALRHHLLPLFFQIPEAICIPCFLFLHHLRQWWPTETLLQCTSLFLHNIPPSTHGQEKVFLFRTHKMRSDPIKKIYSDQHL